MIVGFHCSVHRHKYVEDQQPQAHVLHALVQEGSVIANAINFILDGLGSSSCANNGRASHHSWHAHQHNRPVHLSLTMQAGVHVS